MPKLDAATVVSMALSELGEEHSTESIQCWVDGSSAPPPSISAALEAILNNLDYHLRGAQSRMLSDDDINDNSLRKLASLPPIERKRKAKARSEQRFGEVRVYIGDGHIMLSPQAADTLGKMTRAMGIHRNELIQMWLEEAINAVVKASQPTTKHIEDRKKTKRRRRVGRLPTPEIKRTIQRLQSMSSEEA